MIEALKKSISQNFDGVSFNLENWGEVIDKSSDVSVFYLKSTVDYYSSYFEGVNLSFVLFENKMPISIFPLFVHKKENNWFLSCDGNNLIKPLFIKSIAEKAKKRSEKQILEITCYIARKLEIKKVHIVEFSPALSEWYLLWLDKASKSFLTHQLAIDLRLTIESIRMSFRRSYKTLVNKALREWDIDVCDSDIEHVFEEFRLLHLEVSGRETRVRETWDIQKEQVKNKEALLITVRDGGILIGAGLFTYTKDMGSSSVGAYKRELFDKPIGHGVQMKAIEALKEKGCKTYHIGQKTTLLDDNIPTCKEMSISYFKEGFAGYVYAQPHLEVNLNE